MNSVICILLIAVTLSACAPLGAQRLELRDEHDARLIPIEARQPNAKACSKRCAVIVFGTGYRASIADYQTLLDGLARLGFFVVAIQHDLLDDPPMPNTGDIIKDRSPYWNRGSKSIGVIVNTLSKRWPQHDWSRLILMGHSNGGDIAATYHAQATTPIAALITLDNRRVALAQRGSRVLSLRSIDQVADIGVLPTEQVNRSDFCILTVPETRHDDMCERARPEAKAFMLDTIATFLLQHRCK
jgi:pimeloyl-ACP methyl ester carboxylesterase